ncbi:DUF4928 family protein [Nonomuraea sp. NPDC046802]|uniref:DUF4928 family protein n=1 Tax=Nonomuraea sp. NPDC046802 TaxID=3154919 RepID=UPI0033E426A9
MINDSELPGAFVEATFSVLQSWYESRRRSNGHMNTNVMCVALVMVEHITANYPLMETDYLTDTQIKGIGRARIRAILDRQGETRPFREEAGRTTRGSVPIAKNLAALLNDARLEQSFAIMNDEAKIAVRDELHRRIVDWIRRDFFEQQFISAEIDPSLPVRSSVESILEAARRRPGTTAGAVAQHLVGAKLACRFPHLNIANEGYTVADQQTDRIGDFQVGDSAFHVTMSPSARLLEDRCRSNRAEGYRPVVIVPYNKVEAARQLAETAGLGGMVQVLAIEDFVGQNIEELGVFKHEDIKLQFRALLETYNERVSSVESDPALRIAIPRNL